MFDGGSDGGLYKADIQEAVDLVSWDPQHMGITTAKGTVWDDFARAQIRFIGQHMGRKEIINSDRHRQNWKRWTWWTMLPESQDYMDSP